MGRKLKQYLAWRISVCSVFPKETFNILVDEVHQKAFSSNGVLETILAIGTKAF